jgi:RNA polymerase sigma-70 factor, ECF subfamily
MFQPDKSNALLATLVRKAQAGDRSAESALMTTLEPVVRGFFMRRVGHHAELDDLVQNTLLRVFRGMKEINDGARVRGFALKAALFELQDLYRGRYGSREATLTLDMAEPSVRPESEGLGIDIERALGALNPKTRRIIELKSLGYKYGEIAVALDTTEAAVKMQVKRALERLRASLGVVVAFLVPASGVLLFADLVRLLF